MMIDMEKPSRDFKGVWIPREIWESRQLSIMEKVLFQEIHSLDNERGCYAGNKYFADFFDVSERQIQNVIASLKRKGFIIVTIRNRYERVIRAAGKHARVHGEQLRQLRQDQANLAKKFRRGGMK
jgi:hypothetical protein